MSFYLRCLALLSTALLAIAALRAVDVPPQPKKEKENEILQLNAFVVSGPGNFGATPGGAKDIRFFRMGARSGQIPHPNTFTAEGLFSEHDLPLDLGDESDALFRVQSAAKAARFDALPEVRYLAQLGLSSGLKVDTWRRAPLNLVAVVDKSGSMDGEPLAMVRASLKTMLRQLRTGDQLAIVLYGDRAHVHLPPTRVSRATRSTLVAQIEAIESMGSTDMESGLRLGYEVARAAKNGFKGDTRVMLFTDERPNVGDTSAEGFMAMATAASHEGIGLTTIGVGVQFGAELATRISSVRGGNLFFFSQADEMKKTFADELDTMVTELAHDFSIRITPARGLTLVGAFGVPADQLRWDGDALVLDVATIFLSPRKGGIYFALAPTPGAEPPARPGRNAAPLAEISFSYRNAADGERISGTTSCRLIEPAADQAGLTRGALLVDQYLTLKKAAQLHLFENNQEAAFSLVSGLFGRLKAANDPDLASELTLVRDMHNTLALLSGHAGEVRLADNRSRGSLLVGTWKQREEDDVFLVVWPNGEFEFVRDGHRRRVQHDGPLPTGARGKLRLGPGHRGESLRFELSGDTLRLDAVATESGSSTLTFSRCSYRDLPAQPRIDDEPREPDDISGLPRRPAREEPTSAQARRSTQ